MNSPVDHDSFNTVELFPESESKSAGERKPVFRALIKLDIKPGKESQFKDLWLDFSNTVAGQQHRNLGQCLMRASDDQSVYYIMSDWTDEQAFREFQHSSHHDEHRDDLMPLINGLSLSTTHVLYSVGGLETRVGEG